MKQVVLYLSVKHRSGAMFLPPDGEVDPRDQTPAKVFVGKPESERWWWNAMKLTKAEADKRGLRWRHEWVEHDV